LRIRGGLTLNESRRLSTITVAGARALPFAALGDCVADDSETTAMKAKILKNPPAAETLPAPPDRCSQIDDVAVRGQVTVADVTQVRYFVHAKKNAVKAVNKLKRPFGR